MAIFIWYFTSTTWCNFCCVQWTPAPISLFYFPCSLWWERCLVQIPAHPTNPTSSPLFASLGPNRSTRLSAGVPISLSLAFGPDSTWKFLIFFNSLLHKRVCYLPITLPRPIFFNTWVGEEQFCSGTQHMNWSCWSIFGEWANLTSYMSSGIE